MLSDRFYMRESPSDRKTAILTWLVAAIIAAFFIEVAFVSWFRADAGIFQNLEVTIPGLRVGRVWTLLSYGFLHWDHTHNLLHIGAVVVGVWFFGSELLPSLGPRRLIGLYAGALVLGALFWAAANWSHPNAKLFGGMAGVHGLLTVFACLRPNREISIYPFAIKPRKLVLGLAAAEFLAVLFYELYGATAPFPYAPSAHLGGMVAGLVYYRYIHSARWRTAPAELEPAGPSRRLELPAQRLDASEPARTGPATRDEFRAELDRILDKINSAGLNSLTPAERRVLDSAKDLLTRR